MTGLHAHATCTCAHVMHMHMSMCMCLSKSDPVAHGELAIFFANPAPTRRPAETAPHMPCFTLWATDELRLVTDKSSDSLSLALTCRSLRDAVWDRYFCERREDHRACALKWPSSAYFAAPFENKGAKLRSSLHMYVVSPSRLSWALSVGCPLSSDVCAASARGTRMPAGAKRVSAGRRGRSRSYRVLGSPARAWLGPNATVGWA